MKGKQNQIGVENEEKEPNQNEVRYQHKVGRRAPEKKKELSGKFYCFYLLLGFIAFLIRVLSLTFTIFKDPLSFWARPRLNLLVQL